MIQNALNGNWDGKGTCRADGRSEGARGLPRQARALARQQSRGWRLLRLRKSARQCAANYRAFLADAQRRFAPRGWVVAIAAPVGNPEWNLPAYAKVTDKIFLMAYDEHETSGEPGPIASQHWFVEQVANASRGIPPQKLVVAIGSYAYNWSPAGNDAMSVEEAWQAARDSGTVPTFDRSAATAASPIRKATRAMSSGCSMRRPPITR